MPKIFAGVRAALVRTIMSGQALAPFPRRHCGTCMDVFGVDVMFDSSMDQAYVLEVNLAPALSSPGGGVDPPRNGNKEVQPSSDYVNQMVHDRVLLHTIGMLSRRRTPTKIEVEALRQRVVTWIPRANNNSVHMQAASGKRLQPFRLCDAGEESEADEEDLAPACIGEKALLSLWRLEDEAMNLGLWQRIYPDGTATKVHDQFWLNNAESRETVGKPGPSLVQRLTSAWTTDFLEAGFSTVDDDDNKVMLERQGWGGGSSQLLTSDWLEALRGMDPEWRTETQ